jgi:dethiobiotin synthetase
LITPVATKPFRLFIAGTDTGIGKTETACAVLSLLADAKLRPVPFKPYESGCADLRRPADALALRAAARSDDDLARICVHRFKEPLAPGIAARRLGQVPDFQKTLDAFQSFKGRTLVAEAAGGLLVPIDPERDILDLAAALKLPVLLVARAGLGTLNHTGLSLMALARRRVKVAAVVLSRSQAAKDPSERDNAAILEERHGLPVLGPVPYVEDAARRRAAFRRVLKPWLTVQLATHPGRSS